MVGCTVGIIVYVFYRLRDSSPSPFDFPGDCKRWGPAVSIARRCPSYLLICHRSAFQRKQLRTYMA